MGKKRLGGYVFYWWKGDHSPRHVHVYDSSGRFLGRLRVDNFSPIGTWTPSRRVIELAKRLKREVDL